jgi:hypothetical protein
VVAVANHNPDYSTVSQFIIPIIIHVVCTLAGIILIGLAMRQGKTVAATVKN